MTPASTLLSNETRQLAYPAASDYLRILSRFPRYAERGMKRHEDLDYFGDPSHDENGMRTMGNFVFVSALLASDPGYDEAAGGLTATQLLDRAHRGLSYMTQTHVTGERKCPTGQQWGRAWQSAWWTAKMAFGALLVWDSLTAEERDSVGRVVVDEAEQQLRRRANSGLFIDTKAEENAWDAEILAVALSLFPGHERAPAWHGKLIEFTANTLSAPQDHTSNKFLDGRPAEDLIYTTNIHSDFTIENHGAYHFCYVASPLQSIAFSYYALTSAGLQVPESLHHNVEEFWNRAKTTFLDNRFAYVSGKEWARYTYGLYFIVPALVMFQDCFADRDARNIESARVERFESEQSENRDGSFFGSRVSHDQFHGQAAKYETDCYASLGLAYLLRRTLDVPSTSTPPARFARNISGRHISPESGLAWVRTPELFASFSWRSLETPEPMALFIPSGMDDAAEWQPGNLLGHVDFGPYERALVNQHITPHGCGFRAEGTVMYWDRRGEILNHFVTFTVEPDSATAFVHSEFVAKRDLIIRRATGLTLHIANDRFNGRKRCYRPSTMSGPITINARNNGRPKPRLQRAFQKLARLLGFDGKRIDCGHGPLSIEGKLQISNLQDFSRFELHVSPYNTANHSIGIDLVTTGSRRWFRVRAGSTVLRSNLLLTTPRSPEYCHV
jgi:hypothetical protein